MKTILVFAHEQNTFDKRELLKNPSPMIKETEVVPKDFITDDEIYNFFTKEIDGILDKYSYGRVKNKPDVIKQTQEIFVKREKMQADRMEEMRKQQEFQQIINTIKQHTDINNTNKK